MIMGAIFSLPQAFHSLPRAIVFSFFFFTGLPAVGIRVRLSVFALLAYTVREAFSDMGIDWKGQNSEI